MRKIIALVAILPFLSACDRIADMLEMPDSARETVEAEAIGSGCRQTGRSIEDCYALNPEARKSAIFSGWKSMNEYMMEREIKEVPSVVSRNEVPAPQPDDKPAQATEPVDPAVAQAGTDTPAPKAVTH
ncbi:MAG: hypothetical protein LBE22_00450 [Azoarcus sp.]|jgi:hypothetical protein|nr:hypothetical protein [Azoarcus sp.]